MEFVKTVLEFEAIRWCFFVIFVDA